MREPSIPQALSNQSLIDEILANSSLLINRQVKLAKLELLDDLEKGKSTAKSLGAAAALLYGGILFLLAAASVVIGQALGSLAIGMLLVAGGLLAIGGVVGAIGWSSRIRKPMARSLNELNQEISWTRQQLS